MALKQCGHLMVTFVLKQSELNNKNMYSKSKDFMKENPDGKESEKRSCIRGQSWCL